MEQRKYLKWYHKVGYGTGDVAGNCVYALLTAFMMIYLTDTVGLSMGIVSTLIAVSKIFDGVSDFFFGIYDAARSVNAGLDIEMPYTFRYASLASRIKKGDISEDTVNTCVGRILRALLRTLPAHKKYPKNVILSKEHTDLAREVAAKGMVLLKNKDKALPIKNGTRIAVVGRYADKITAYTAIPNKRDFRIPLFLNTKRLLKSLKSLLLRIKKIIGKARKNTIFMGIFTK